MNRNEFSEIVNRPLSREHSWNEIPLLAGRFPFCSVLQVLSALNMYRENDMDFGTSLKKAAAYSISRKKLKELFEKADSYTEEPAEPVVELTEPAEEQRQPEPFIQPVVHIPEPPKETPTREELIRKIHQRLEEIERERAGESGPVTVEKAEKDAEEEEKPAVADAKEEGNRKLTKEEIIEKFIREEPRISPPRQSFFNPSENAMKSSTDDDEIVSETLAKIYSEQGNKAKAIRIYQKLCLVFPEKSSYFAAQIEKLKS